MFGLSDQAKRIAVFVILAANLLTPLLAGSGNVFQVSASPVSYTLYGTTQGWGFSSTTVTSPGPDLTAPPGENVTITLISSDGVRHDFSVDYNANGIPDPGEPLSPGFGGRFPSSITYEFALTTTPGTYTYYCEFHAQQFGSFLVVVNNAPVLDPIGPRTVNEENLLSFTATATDPDPGQKLTFSLGAGAPADAFMTSGGVFTWTPTEDQGPGGFNATVIVSDGSLTDSETVSITVNETNRPPVLAAPGNQSVNAGSPLTFPVSSSDPDIPANSLTLSSINLPAGAVFPTATGTGSVNSTFSWTPTPGQVGTYNVAFTATDDGTPMLSDTQTISITVTSAGSTPPTLDPIGPRTVNEEVTLTFTATATDPDVGQALTFSLGAGAPTGASIGPLTGVFTWAPTEAQGPNVYTVTIVVTDSGSPSAFDSETITVTVSEVNLAPVIVAIPSTSANEGSPLSLAVTATDADLDSTGQPLNTITLTASGLPTGASFTYTPAKGSVTETFSWTPSENQAPQTTSVTFTATDDGSPFMSDTKMANVTVNEVNAEPTIIVPGTQSVNQGSSVSFTISATDPDLDGAGQPINTVALSASGLPTGATFDPATGTFSWTPASSQVGTYTVTFTATDNGSPPMSDLGAVEFRAGVIPEIHDCAIVSVESTPSYIPSGVTVTTKVVVTNKGTVSESFNLTLSHETKTIAVKRITSLIPGSGFTETFEWNTAGLSPGNYTLTVSLENLPGETSLADNGASVTVNVIQLPSSSSLPYYPYLVGAVAAGIIGLLAYPFVGGRRRGSNSS